MLEADADIRTGVMLSESKENKLMHHLCLASDCMDRTAVSLVQIRHSNGRVDVVGRLPRTRGGSARSEGESRWLHVMWEALTNAELRHADDLIRIHGLLWDNRSRHYDLVGFPHRFLFGSGDLIRRPERSRNRDEGRVICR